MKSVEVGDVLSYITPIPDQYQPIFVVISIYIDYANKNKVICLFPDGDIYEINKSDLEGWLSLGYYKTI